MSYFDRHYGRGEAWYRGQFPSRPWLWLTGGRSRPHGRSWARRARATCCTPPRRRGCARSCPTCAWSSCCATRSTGRCRTTTTRSRSAGSRSRSRRRSNREPERLEGELERLGDTSYFSHAWWDYTYLARGRYAEQLERWLAVFPREQLLVLASERLRADPASSLRTRARASRRGARSSYRTTRSSSSASTPRWRRRRGDASRRRSTRTTSASTRCSARTSGGRVPEAPRACPHAEDSRPRRSTAWWAHAASHDERQTPSGSPAMSAIHSSARRPAGPVRRRAADRPPA